MSYEITQERCILTFKAKDKTYKNKICPDHLFKNLEFLEILCYYFFEYLNRVILMNVFRILLTYKY